MRPGTSDATYTADAPGTSDTADADQRTSGTAGAAVAAGTSDTSV